MWNKLENVLASAPGGINSKMQIIRLKTDAGERIVGKLRGIIIMKIYKAPYIKNKNYSKALYIQHGN